MRLRSRTKRRLMLIGAVGGVIAIVAFSLVFVRAWQNQRLTARYRAEALKAYEAKDYYTTLVRAGSYLKRGDKRDPEILLAYSRARSNLQEHDGHHISDAIPFYTQYLEVRPKDKEAAMELLKLYNLRTFYKEAIDLAGTLRPAKLEECTIADFPVLKEEALALVRNKSFDDPTLGKVLDRMEQLNPDHPSAPLFRVQAASRMDPQGRFRKDAKDALDKYVAAHPNTPAAHIASAAVVMLFQSPNWQTEARALLSQAAGLDPEKATRVAPAAYTDPDTPVLLVQMLDSVYAQEHSMQVMRDAEDRLKLAEVKPLLLRRLWQEGMSEELEQRTRGVDPADTTTDPMVLAFRALALNAAGRKDEVQPLIAALEAREGDFRTSSWADALPLADVPEQPKFIERVDTLRGILKNNPVEPIFHVWLGNTLAALGRNDEARGAWKDAITLPEGRAWAFPHARIAETLLLDGRVEEAQSAVAEAVRVAGTRAYIAVLYYEVQAARIQKTTLDPESVKRECAEFLTSIGDIKAKLAEHAGSAEIAKLQERLLVPEVVFLARSGAKDQARALALGVLDSDRPLEVSTVNSLALAGTIEQIDIADACDRRRSQKPGAQATVGLAKALDHWAKGKPELGTELLTADIKANPSSPEARLALARYLEIIDDDGALAAWKDAAEAFKDNLHVQRTALGAKAIAADPELVDAIIGRYRTLAGIERGVDDLPMRVARARMLLHGSPTLRERDEAISLIGLVISENPRLVEAKLMLASALSIADPAQKIKPDMPRAIGVLTEAYTLDPSSVPTALELARLHQLLGQFDRSRELLNRIAQNQSLNWKLRLIAAEALVKQGDIRTVAQAALADIAEQADEQTLPKVLVTLAEIQESLRSDQVGPLYERIAGLAADGDSIYAAARHFSLAGNKERVSELLARLDGLPPAVKELTLARLAATLNEPEKAVDHFEAAAKLDPTLPEVWRHYAGMYLRGGDYVKAKEIVERGVKEAPGDQSLSLMQDQANLLVEGVGDPDLRILVQSLVQTPGMANAQDIVKTVRDLRQNGQLETVDGLTKLADRYSGSPAVQIYAANRMSGMDAARASALVNRAMAANPADPTPARLAAEIYLHLERWNDLITAATAWRERDASRSAEPDLAIAQAYLNLRQFEQGIKTLNPRLANAIANPEAEYSPGILNIYAQLLIKSGQERQALEKLLPAFTKSNVVRLAVGVRLAAAEVPTYDGARHWLKVLMDMDPSSHELQLAGAGALVSLATRFGQQQPSLHDQLMEEAKTIVQRFTTGDGERAEAWEFLGILHNRTQRLDEAKAAYRRAIELDPMRTDAMNNLAYLLMNEGGLDEALTLASRAVEQDKERNSAHLDTLATIHKVRAEKATDPQVKAGEYRKAAEAYKKAAETGAPDLKVLRLVLEEVMRAAYLGGDYEMALWAVESIQKTRPDPSLAASCQNNEAEFLLLKGNAKDLPRALGAAEAAVRFQEVPAFLSTLGWVHLQMGSIPEAEQTFRRAVQRTNAGEAPLTSVTIGLATSLAGSKDAAKLDEASKLLEGVDTAALSAENRARFERVKTQLASGTP